VSDRTWLSDLRMRLVTTFYRRATLMVRDLGETDTAPAHVAARMATISMGELDSYLEFRPRADRRVIERRLEKGDEGVVAWVDAQIVHAAWIATGRSYVAYLDRDLLLAPDELLVYDSFTIPELRGSGIARARMAHVFAEYARRGYRRCFAIVAVENSVGAHTMQSGGYRKTGRFSCLRLGPWSRCWQSSTSDRVPALARPS
jgi:GNAT superfamily N-acetyltransferase